MRGHSNNFTFFTFNKFNQLGETFDLQTLLQSKDEINFLRFKM